MTVNDKKKAPVDTSSFDPLAIFVGMMMRGTDDYIKSQEASGQMSLCASDTLPTRGNRQALEAAGVRFLDVVPNDDIFTFVELPRGWSKRATDHSLWTDLLDEKGRKRASIFYKAAFYDRDAHFSASTRYVVSSRYDETTRRYKDEVRDGERVLFESEWFSLDDYELGRAQREKCVTWLTERFPDWRDVAAYWD